jgi:hypothetical protein
MVASHSISVGLLAVALAATPAQRPRVPRCYRVAVAAWSPPLGVDRSLYIPPPVVTLDTLAAPGGPYRWRLAPDLLHPPGARTDAALPTWVDAGGGRVLLQWGNEGRILRLVLDVRADSLVGIAQVLPASRTPTGQWEAPTAAAVLTRAPCTRPSAQSSRPLSPNVR